jgi:hypothetical protein
MKRILLQEPKNPSSEVNLDWLWLRARTTERTTTGGTSTWTWTWTLRLRQGFHYSTVGSEMTEARRGQGPKGRIA